MAANYITSADVDAMIGSGRRQALFTDPGGSYSSANFVRVCELASAVVRAAAHEAGYTSLGESTTNDQVILAALGQFLMMSYGRKGEAVPDQFAAAVHLAEAIRSGNVPIVGISPSTGTAIGGSSFTESDADVDGARVQLFSRDEQDVY